MKRNMVPRKLGAAVLILTLCLSLMVTGAWAAEPSLEGNWTDNGNYDISWYNDTDSEFTLSDAADLAGLAVLVNGGNTFAGKTIYLANDIDLAGREWTSIGTGNNVNNYFGGTFDGKGYAVSHLTSQNSTTYYHGLFGIISSNGLVQNLSIIDANIYSYDTSLRMGILADWINIGTVKNCYTSGTVHNASGNKLLGGVIGTGTSGSKIISCASDAIIISDYYDSGDGYSDCDTVGGIVGQWENATSESLIADCWFGGSISCGFQDSGVGGILGANFDFGDTDPGVTIQNCMVVTKEIRCAEPGNITWIAAVVNSTVENCLWPDSPPEDVTLDPEIYEGYNGTYLAVTKLVVDWDQGTASADPNFDQSTCGQTVSDFNSDAILTALNKNASEGVEWVRGVEHPVLSWDAENAYVSVNGVSLDVKELSLSVDDTATLTAIVTPDDATNKTVTWTSSDPSVATVDANGLVTAVAPGTATITATADGVSATCTVTVTRPYTPPANPNYRIDITDTANGTVIADPTSAKAGTTVTLTPVPDEGYALGSLAVTDRFGDPVALTEQADGTYTFTMPNGQVTVSATFVEVEEPAAEPFTDVDESDWFYEDVAYVYENGLMNGVGEGLFGPEATTTRAMVVTILYRLEGEPTVTGDTPFTDLVAGQYYLDAVAWASTNDIVNGVTSTTFAPNDPITREQMAAILYRYAQYKGMDTTDRGNLGSFADGNTVSPYAVEAMAWANAEGLINGVENNRLNPTGQAPRSQVAAILHRFCTME